MHDSVLNDLCSLPNGWAVAIEFVVGLTLRLMSTAEREGVKIITLVAC